MNFQTKTDQLADIIKSTLDRLITNDYILLDLPYYSNIGDTLIWEGTRHYLKTISFKCLYTASKETFIYKRIPESTIILLQGGGNFGDIWREHQEFRLKITKIYPNNRIIFLPQSIHYENKSYIIEDAKQMNKHQDLHICARDNNSLDTLTQYFKNHHYLLPDMAFCIPFEYFSQYQIRPTNKTLFLKRNDKEYYGTKFKLEISNIEYRDWPSMEQVSIQERVINKMTNFSRRLSKGSPLFKLVNKSANFYATSIYRPHLIKTGAEFVLSYKDIYTTRLHLAILSVILHKEFKFLDNSYGKNKSFYDTWLSDLNGIEFIN